MDDHLCLDAHDRELVDAASGALAEVGDRELWSLAHQLRRVRARHRDVGGIGHDDPRLGALTGTLDAVEAELRAR